jgi:hypothetical protein
MNNKYEAFYRLIEQSFDSTEILQQYYKKLRTDDVRSNRKKKIKNFFKI